MGSGADLCGRFYRSDVRPLLVAGGLAVPHAAALVGRGSEVLGYDDNVSKDHDWVARVTVFLMDDSADLMISRVHDRLKTAVPATFEGVLTQVDVTTWQRYLTTSLGIDGDRQVSELDLIVIPEYELIRMASAHLYEDQIGLQDRIQQVSYYPHDVWLYLMSACWWRLHPEVNLIGRVGSTGDTLGSSLIASTLVRELVNLCFLLERTYQPYAKWVGRAFSQLTISGEISEPLLSAMSAAQWQGAERSLLAAYEIAATAQNRLGVCSHVEPSIVRLWDRPFRSLWGDFPGALMEQVTDPTVKALGRCAPSGIEGFRTMMLRPERRRFVRQALQNMVASP